MSVSNSFQSRKPESGLRRLPVLCILLQNTLYGFGDPISKAAYEVLSVFSLLSARYGIALLFLLLAETLMAAGLLGALILLACAAAETMMTDKRTASAAG